jgi:predicted DNA-binding protein (UPF0251 family)
MTLKEMYQKEEKWYKICIIIETFHFMRTLTDKKWRLEDTARELEISKALVSENLKLAIAFNKDKELQGLSRNAALKRINGRE